MKLPSCLLLLFSLLIHLHLVQSRSFIDDKQTDITAADDDQPTKHTSVIGDFFENAGKVSFSSLTALTKSISFNSFKNPTVIYVIISILFVIAMIIVAVAKIRKCCKNKKSQNSQSENNTPNEFSRLTSNEEILQYQSV